MSPEQVMIALIGWAAALNIAMVALLIWVVVQSKKWWKP